MFAGMHIATQFDLNKYDHQTSVNLLPGHGTSFNLIIRIKVRAILFHDKLHIVLSVKDEDGTVVRGPIESTLNITGQKSEEQKREA